MSAVAYHLSEISNDDLADELEARGYIVYNDSWDVAQSLSDDDVIEEYKDRGLHVFDEIKDAIYFVQSKGYSVYRTNEIEDIWHDIYSHALTMEHNRFMQWLNGQFIMHIERWI